MFSQLVTWKNNIKRIFTGIWPEHAKNRINTTTGSCSSGWLSARTALVRSFSCYRADLPNSLRQCHREDCYSFNEYTTGSCFAPRHQTPHIHSQRFYVHISPLNEATALSFKTRPEDRSEPKQHEAAKILNILVFLNCFVTDGSTQIREVLLEEVP